MKLSKELYLCTKHGLDYRMVCDECQYKYVLFTATVEKQVKESLEENEKLNKKHSK